MTWKTFVAMKLVAPPVETFKEACELMYDGVKKLLEQGTSYQVLESTVWIENTGNNPSPIMFYDAKDIACELGWIQNGKWIE